jgi:hypothetical protein
MPSRHGNDVTLHLLLMYGYYRKFSLLLGTRSFDINIRRYNLYNLEKKYKEMQLVQAQISNNKYLKTENSLIDNILDNKATQLITFRK